MENVFKPEECELFQLIDESKETLENKNSVVFFLLEYRRRRSRRCYYYEIAILKKKQPFVRCFV